MEKQEFKVVIEAPQEKVWNVLWNDNTYREWTSVFSPGSHAETDWKKGSKVLFLDGKGDGMVSRIAENIPNTYMSIEHLGTMKKGTKEMDDKESQSWSGAKENYTLKPVNGKTELKVDMDVTEEFKDYFQKTWPKALDKLKHLAESN